MNGGKGEMVVTARTIFALWEVCQGRSSSNHSELFEHMPSHSLSKEVGSQADESGIPGVARHSMHRSSGVNHRDGGDVMEFLTAWWASNHHGTVFVAWVNGSMTSPRQ